MTAPITLGQPARPRPAATPEQQALLDFADSLPPLRPTPERDSRGRYILPDHATLEARAAWTRVTTFAGAIDDDFALERWGQRMTAIGIGKRPQLAAQIALLDDPHDHPGQRQQLNDIVADAMAIAGAHLGSELGTAMHTVTEHFDHALATGQNPPPPPAPYTADVLAYHHACRNAGLELPAEWIERIVVCPDLNVAGTLDRIATWEGRRHIFDVKTQKTMDFGITKMAIQLACYAHATHMWNIDGGGYEPMPEVDQQVAIVAHMPVGTGTCVLHRINIEAGWELAQLAAKVRTARNTKGLATELHPIAPPAPAPERTGPISMGEAEAAPGATVLPNSNDCEYEVEPVDCVRCASPATAVANTDNGPIPVCHIHAEELAGGPLEHDCAAEAPCPTCGKASEEPGAECVDCHHERTRNAAEERAADAARSDWLMGRFLTLAASESARRLIQSHWPPTVATSHPWTAAEIDQLDELLAAVEIHVDAPFPDRDPDVIAQVEAEQAARAAANNDLPVHPRGWDDPDEGPILDPDRFAAIGAAVTAAYANETTQACLKAWASQGRTSGRPFTPGPNPLGTIVISERRAAIFEAAIAAATHLHEDGDDTLIWAALAWILPDRPLWADDNPLWPLGAVLGALTTTQAQRLHQIAEANASDPTVMAELGQHVAALAAA